MSHLGEDKLLFAFIKDNLNVPNNKLILSRKKKINLIWNEHQSKTYKKNAAKRNKKPLVYGTVDMTSPY